MQIRPAQRTDTDTVLAFLEQTGFFWPGELAIAAEVFADAFDPAQGYHSYVADLDGKPVGWICFGPTPCTLGTWDIYWIAVDKTVQHQRIGSRLLAYAEQEIQNAQGRLAVIETSGSEKYKPTQHFYLKNGYDLAAAVKDFYAPNDPKLIFTKQLSPRSAR